MFAWMQRLDLDPEGLSTLGVVTAKLDVPAKDSATLTLQKVNTYFLLWSH
jgi:hypothetical protein